MSHFSLLHLAVCEKSTRELKLLIKRWFDTFVTRIIDSILLEVLIGETWSYARLQVIMGCVTRNS